LLQGPAVTAYDTSEWTDFFVAGAGASAALTGLVFVAVSINVDRILRFKGLPERALATVLLLLSVVLVSLIGLIPGQSRDVLAGELLGVGLVFGALILVLTKRSTASGGRQRVQTFGHWFMVGLGTLPVVLGAASLFAAAGGGLYWVAAGIVLAMTGAVANAWVLLVEILR
jgi:modulator of FtsH protease